MWHAQAFVTTHAQCSPSLDPLPVALSDWYCIFDGQMSYGPHCYVPISSYLTLPVIGQAVKIHCAAWSGSCCCFISDMPCAQFHDYHLYLNGLYIPYNRERFSPRVQTKQVHSAWLCCAPFLQCTFTSPHVALYLCPSLYLHLAPFCIFSISPCSTTVLFVTDSLLPQSLTP